MSNTAIRQEFCFITNMPEHFDQPHKDALNKMFSTGIEKIRSLGHYLNVEQNRIDCYNPIIYLKTDEYNQEQLRSFAEVLFRKYVANKPRALTYGTPRVGPDLLFIEVIVQDSLMTMSHAWLYQNCTFRNFDYNNSSTNEIYAGAMLSVHGDAVQNDAVTYLAVDILQKTFAAKPDAE